MKNLIRATILIIICFVVSFGISEISAYYCWPEQGCLGTDTIPTAAQVPQGTSGGVYEPSSVLGLGDVTPEAVLEVTTVGTAEAYFMVSSNAAGDGDYFKIDGSGDITAGGDLDVTGTGTFNNLNIEGGIPILVFKDTTDAGDSARGFQEWRDSNNVRLGFFGNHSYTNDDLKWKNESSGGHLLLETTGGGNVGIGTTSPNATLDVNGTAIISGGLYGINVETLTGDKTLTPETDKMYQYLDEGGANRTITLATATATAGDRFVIRHNGDWTDGHFLDVKQGATRLDLIYAANVKEFIFDGTDWIIRGLGTGESDNKSLNISIGSGSQGYYGGAAFGSASLAFTYGAAIGWNARGNTHGAAVGQSAYGYEQGAAVGYEANGLRRGVAVGYKAGYLLDLTADRYNIFIGWQNGDNVTTGTYNILLGTDIDTPAVDTDNFMSLGNLIFATGVDGTGTTVSSGNVGIGDTSPDYPLEILSTTSPQMAITATDGSAYVDFGVDSNNVFTINSGGGRLFSNYGTGNLFLGQDAFNNDFGEYNIGIGYQAGYNNDTTGAGDEGDYNVYMGYQAGYGAAANNTGYSNVGLGYKTLYKNTTGYSNSIIGANAFSNNTIGRYNSAIGYYAGRYNQTGDYNVIMGSYAGGYGAGGVNSFDNNTFLGYASGYNITTGSDNVFLGYKSGYNQTDTSNLLIIDNQDRGSAAAEAVEALIYGTFNDTYSSQLFTINASLGLNDDTPDAILEITTSTSGQDLFYISTDKAQDGDIFKVDSNGNITFNNAYTFPTSDGNADEVLGTDGSGTLSFVRMPKAIYAQLSDSTDQTFGATGTAQSITFNTNDEIAGITHSTSSNTENITIVTTGVYNIVAQPQVAAGSGASNSYFHMWLQKNTGGEFVDISNSNVELTLSTNDEDVILLNAIVSLNAGDIIRVMSSVGHTNIKLDAQTPGSEPAIPSIIFSMFMVGSG